MGDIINSSVIAPKKKELELDPMTYEDMVKIKEKKRKLRNKSKAKKAEMKK